MVIHCGFEFLEGLCEELAELGCGKDAGIKAAFAHHAEVLHVCLESDIGHGARVLEFTEDSIVEAVEIAFRDDLFKGAAAIVCDTMLRVCEPAQEVLRGIVERVFDEVVADTEIGVPFSVDESLSIPVEDLSHEDMAAHASMMTHSGCNIPSVLLFFTPCRRVIMR